MTDLQLTLVARAICRAEGFRRTPYPDPLSGGEPWTFGHGLTWITEDESRAIVEGRVAKLEDDVRSMFSDMEWTRIGERRQGVLVEMSFQLGVFGLSQFKNMLAALKTGEWAAARAHALDSHWHRQTEKRAERLAKILELGDA